MPFVLDEIDAKILKALQEDARKSFREVAREIKVSTPTVAARFQRLVNIGLIKSASLVFDFDKIEDSELKAQLIKIQNSTSATARRKIGRGTRVTLTCDYCHGPISNKPVILRFANFERYLCCTSCRDSYKEKHKGRIASLARRYGNSD
jgi:Lrp/AsnC family leucine-responsive transcriptional regulator